MRHPDSYAMLMSMGARPVMTIYPATLNIARTWCDDQWNAKPMRIGPWGGVALDWSRAGNHTDPPNLRALAACAKLAVNPSFYGDDSPPGPRPIMIDIEGTKSINLVGAEHTIENRRQSIRHMIDCIRTAKEATGGKCEVWGYGWFPQAMYYPKDQLPIYEKTRDVEAELAKEASAVCLSLYNWDRVAETDGAQWFEDLAGVEALIDKDFLQFKHRKVVLMLPVWQVIWPEHVKPEHAAMNGKPVPLELWKRQIDVLVKHGWDIYVWTGSVVIDDIRPHLEYVGRFAK
jgi:hypothetical protein